MTLGQIQDDGIVAFPLMAQQFGLSKLTSISNNKNEINDTKSEDRSLSDNSEADLRKTLKLLESSSSLELFNLDNDDQLSLGDMMILNSSPPKPLVNMPTTILKSNSNDSVHEEFMVEIICKRFLQLFLVGVSLF